jgi:hypothetical protein
MSICGEDRSRKPSPQPGEKGAKFLPPFPPQGRSLSRCVTKIRELATGARNHAKIHVIVNKSVSRISRHEREKTRGRKMKDSLAILLKTNGGKMSDFASLAMLMKTNDLFLFSGDSDEKKGC